MLKTISGIKRERTPNWPYMWYYRVDVHPQLLFLPLLRCISVILIFLWLFLVSCFPLTYISKLSKYVLITYRLVWKFFFCIYNFVLLIQDFSEIHNFFKKIYHYKAGNSYYICSCIKRIDDFANPRYQH